MEARPTDLDIEAAEKMADDLYNRGYRDAIKERNQDARGCEEWQVVVDAIAPLATPADAGAALTDDLHTEIVGAVARGWCAPINAHKEMDSYLAHAIVLEVEQVLARLSTSAAPVTASQPAAQVPSIDRDSVLEEAAQACMRATPDRAHVRRIGEAAHYTACRDAIRALKGKPAAAHAAKSDGWISVDERLPEENVVVALLDETRWMNTGCQDFYTNWHGAGYLTEVGQRYWSVFGETRAVCLDAITHWMTLPAAPIAAAHAAHDQKEGEA